MQIDQSGKDNVQHVGDVINHYYFGKSKEERGSVKLPLKVCRITLLIPSLIYMIPIIAVPIYAITGRHMPSVEYMNTTIFGFLFFLTIGWYLLPVLFPSLLITLYGDRLRVEGKTIMFTDIFRMERTGSSLELFMLDGREITIRFDKEKCARLVLEYYGMAVAA